MPSLDLVIAGASFAGLSCARAAATIEEGRASIHFEEQVRDAQIVSLGDLPLIYLLAGRDRSSGPEWTEELIASEEELNRELAAEAAQLSSSGEVVLVSEASHDIQLDAPEEIVGAIRRIVDSYHLPGG